MHLVIAFSFTRLTFRALSTSRFVHNQTIIMTETASPTSVQDTAKRASEEVASESAKKAKVETSADAASTLEKTHAYGKLILFGEHFVVYKVPALVGAVAAYTDCAIEVADVDEKDADNEKETGVVEIVDNDDLVLIVWNSQKLEAGMRSNITRSSRHKNGSLWSRRHGQG